MSHRQAKRGRAKKDTGIARLANGTPISEETRDQLTKHNWAEGPRRTPDPNDADNWTTKECMEKGFSGFRYNKLRRMMELWCLGHLEGSIPEEQCTPEAMATLHEKIFATNGTLVEVPLRKPQ